MKRIWPLFIVLLTVAAHAQVPGCTGAHAYFVSPTGSNASSGLAGSPWLTGAYAGLQQSNGTIQPGSTITFSGFTTIYDQIVITNPTVPTSSTTTPAILPASGSMQCPITWNLGPTNIDAADIVSPGTITNVGGGVYSFVLSTYPEKLFVDDNNTDTPQLAPQVNAKGQWSSTASYNGYDLVNSGYQSNLTGTGGSGMTIGTYAVAYSGLTCGTLPTGTVTVTSASAYTIAFTPGAYCSGTATATVATGGTPPTLTSTILQNQWMVDPGVANLTNSVPGPYYPYQNVFNNIIPNGSQQFSNSNTGLQNVTATAGSWYVTASGSNWLVYVHLTGGDSPASHVLKATHRNFNISLNSVDWTIFNGTGGLEHAFLDAWSNVANLRSDLGGNYWSGEYNQLNGVHAFNCANVGTSFTNLDSSQPTRGNNLQTCLLDRVGAETNPHSMRHIYPLHTGVITGTVDDFFSLRGAADADIIDAGIDGTLGGTAPLAMLPAGWGDTINPTNTPGYFYTTTNVSRTDGQLNVGGGFAYETCSNAVECFSVGTTAAFRGHHNFAHDGSAEGIQIGGPSTSSPTSPFIWDHNIISNFQWSRTGVGYNALDCNGVTTSGSFPTWQINNTYYNTAAAGPTFEGNCTYDHFWNNIVDQSAFPAVGGPANPFWPATGTGYNGTNGSSFIYYVGANVLSITPTNGNGMTPGVYTLTVTNVGSQVRQVATAQATVASDGATTTISSFFGGSDYTVAPNVTFSSSPGGTPSTFIATLSGVNSRLGMDFRDNSWNAACSSPTLGCGGARFSGAANTVTAASFIPETGVTLGENNAPQFTNAAGGSSTANDFRLMAGSPQIGAGAVNCILGVCSSPDLGAIAYGQPATFTAPTYVPPTVVTINSATQTLYPSAATGVGMSPGTYFSGFEYDNLLAADNPGFQGIIRDEFHTAGGGTTTSFYDTDPFSSITANLATGWTFKVIAHYNASCSSPSYGGVCYLITGGAYGCTGTVTTNTTGSGTSGGNGPTFNLSSTCPSAIISGDVVQLTAPGPLYQATASGWFTSGGITTTLDTTTANLPPSIAGLPQPTSIMQINSTSTAGTYYTFIDSTQSVIMNGTTTQQLQANLVSGAATLACYTYRILGAGIGQVFIDSRTSPQTVTSGWHTYTCTGSGSETQATNIAQGISVGYVFTGTGNVDIIGASLTGQATNGGAYTHTSGSVLSDQAVINIHAGGWDELRYNYISGGGNIMAGAKVIDLIQPIAYRKQVNASTHNYSGFAGTPFGLHDALVAAQHLGVHRVEYSTGPTWTAADYSNLADYLNGGSGTTYGAYRIALGGPVAGWNSVFTSITDDWNETWNGSGLGAAFGNINYATSLQVGYNAVTALRANANWNPAIDHFAFPVLANGQNVPYINTVDPNGYMTLDSNGYYVMTTANCTQPLMFQNLVAEAYGNTVDSTLEQYTVGAGGRVTDNYEAAGNGGQVVAGGCQTGQTTGLFRGLGGGIIDAIYPAYLQRAFPGIFPRWNKWSLQDGSSTGYTSSASSSPATTVDLWSAYVNPRGMGVAPSTGVYAAAIHNAGAILGTGITPSYSSMVYNVTTAGNSIPAENTEATPVFAYTDGGNNRAFEMWNTDTVNPHTITLNVAPGDTPTGTVTMTTYASHATTPALTDNNDTLNTAPVVYNTTSTGAFQTTYTLAPMTGMVVTGSTSGTGSPGAISITGGVIISGGVVIQ